MAMEVDASLAEKYNSILAKQEFASKSLKPGDTKYLISKRWYDTFKKWLKSGFSPPGPISNHLLVKSGGSSSSGDDTKWRWQPVLQERLSSFMDYAALSKEEWDFLVSSYGGGPEIKRKVIQNPKNGRGDVEVYPSQITVTLVHDGEPDKVVKQVVMDCSNNTRVRSFIELVVNDVFELVEQLDDPADLQVAFAVKQYGSDLYSIELSDDRVLNSQIPELFEKSRANDHHVVVSIVVPTTHSKPKKQLIEGSSSMLAASEQEEEKRAVKAVEHAPAPSDGKKKWIGKPKFNGVSNPLFMADGSTEAGDDVRLLDTAKSGTRDVESRKGSGSEHDCVPKSKSKKRWVAGPSTNVYMPNGWSSRPRGMSDSQGSGKRSRSNVASSSSSAFIQGLKSHNDKQALHLQLKAKSYQNDLAKGNTGTGKPAEGFPPGACGLSNLGNTCYMNAALQCLSNVTELRQFFQQDPTVLKKLLNTNAPLGYKGEMPTEFQDLMNVMWSHKYSSVEPRRFKAYLSKWNPMFAGYRQHDSHEFLSFVLAGLHEDLNRIESKPYVEYDIDGSLDTRTAALEMLQLHRRRESSVITDIFEGLLRSQLSCPHQDCGHRSVSFDPYTVVSLALPVATSTGTQSSKAAASVLPAGVSGPMLPPSMAIDSVDDTTIKGTSITALSLTGTTPKTGEVTSQIDKDITIPLTAKESNSINTTSKSNTVSPVFDPAVLKAVANFATLSSDALYVPHVLTTTDKVRSVEVKVNLPLEQFHQQVKVREKAPQGSKSKKDDISEVNSKSTTLFLGALRSLGPKKGSKSSNSSFQFSDFHMVNRRTPLDKGSVLIAFEHGINDLSKIRGPIRLVHRVRGKSIIGMPMIVVMSETDSVVSASIPKYSNLHLLKNVEEKIKFLEQRVRDLMNQTPNPVPEVLYEVRRLMNNNEEDYNGPVVPSDTKPFNFVGGNQVVLVIDWTVPVFNLVTKAVGEVCGDLTGIRPFSGATAATTHSSGSSAAVTLPRTKLPPLPSVTLETCLQNFSHPETLGEGDSWHCPKCKRDGVNAEKQLNFINGHLPQVLVIQLKRFTKFGLKVRNPVEYPLRGLDLSPYAVGPKQIVDGKEINYEYDLFAITKHLGYTGSSGHYTAHAQAQDGKWYLFDDSRVVPLVNGPSNNDAEAYILYYRRREV